MAPSEQQVGSPGAVQVSLEDRQGLRLSTLGKKSADRRIFLLGNGLLPDRTAGDPCPHFLERHSETMSSHHDNQGLLTTCFPDFTSSALPHLARGLARASQPKVSGLGLRATFPKKRVGRASVKWTLASSSLGVKRVKWGMDQDLGKVLLDLF